MAYDASFSEGNITSDYECSQEISNFCIIFDSLPFLILLLISIFSITILVIGLRRRRTKKAILTALGTLAMNVAFSLAFLIGVITLSEWNINKQVRSQVSSLKETLNNLEILTSKDGIQKAASIASEMEKYPSPPTLIEADQGQVALRLIGGYWFDDKYTMKDYLVTNQLLLDENIPFPYNYSASSALRAL